MNRKHFLEKLNIYTKLKDKLATSLSTNDTERSELIALPADSSCITNAATTEIPAIHTMKLPQA